MAIVRTLLARLALVMTAGTGRLSRYRNAGRDALKLKFYGEGRRSTSYSHSWPGQPFFRGAMPDSTASFHCTG